MEEQNKTWLYVVLNGRVKLTKATKINGERHDDDYDDGTLMEN